MTTGKKHGPLPWEADRSNLVIVDPFGNIVADCETETFECERIANIELIALACNHHYKLVEALTRLSDVSELVCNLRKSNLAIRADIWNEMNTATRTALESLTELEKSAKTSQVVISQAVHME